MDAFHEPEVPVVGGGVALDVGDVEVASNSDVWIDILSHLRQRKESRFYQDFFQELFKSTDPEGNLRGGSALLNWRMKYLQEGGMGYKGPFKNKQVHKLSQMLNVLDPLREPILNQMRMEFGNIHMGPMEFYSKMFFTKVLLTTPLKQSLLMENMAMAFPEYQGGWVDELQLLPAVIQSYGEGESQENARQYLGQFPLFLPTMDSMTAKNVLVAIFSSNFQDLQLMTLEHLEGAPIKMDIHAYKDILKMMLDSSVPQVQDLALRESVAFGVASRAEAPGDDWRYAQSLSPLFHKKETRGQAEGLASDWFKEPGVLNREQRMRALQNVVPEKHRGFLYRDMQELILNPATSSHDRWMMIQEFLLSPVGQKKAQGFDTLKGFLMSVVPEDQKLDLIREIGRNLYSIEPMLDQFFDLVDQHLKLEQKIDWYIQLKNDGRFLEMASKKLLNIFIDSYFTTAPTDVRNTYLQKMPYSIISTEDKIFHLFKENINFEMQLYTAGLNLDDVHDMRTHAYVEGLLRQMLDQEDPSARDVPEILVRGAIEKFIEDIPEAFREMIGYVMIENAKSRLVGLNWDEISFSEIQTLDYTGERIRVGRVLQMAFDLLIKNRDNPDYPIFVVNFINALGGDSMVGCVEGKMTGLARSAPLSSQAEAEDPFKDRTKAQIDNMLQRNLPQLKKFLLNFMDFSIHNDVAWRGLPPGTFNGDPAFEKELLENPEIGRLLDFLEMRKSYWRDILGELSIDSLVEYYRTHVENDFGDFVDYDGVSHSPDVNIDQNIRIFDRLLIDLGFRTYLKTFFGPAIQTGKMNMKEWLLSMDIL